MDIPKILLDEIRGGNVVLFLGAGAAFDAYHPENKKIPLGKDLSKMIAERFLDDTYLDNDLTYNSELAISQTSLYDVQNYIKEIFSKYKPGEHHKLIPRFNWKSIFTTNYDFLLEEAYGDASKTKANLQILNPIYKNTREQDIFKSNNLPYFKLHGSFHVIDDDRYPLILTPDQYVGHKSNREMLYSHLKEYAFSYTMIFVGFSFADLDIRGVLNQIGFSDNRPRAYMIGPYIRPAESSLWESKRITSLVCSFKDFILEVDKVIDPELRMFISKQEKFENPIYSRFSVSPAERKPSDTLVNFIDRDVDFIHRAMAAPLTDPKAFYKGYFENWDPIIRNLDVNRSLKDGILSEVFLAEESYVPTQLFYILKGHAGSGKSVLMKRIAWEASNTFDLFCVFYRPNTTITYEPVYELYNFVRSRIYIFIDQVSQDVIGLERLIQKCQKDRIPITILGSERINVWNLECSSLEKFVEEEFHLKFLNEKEIRELLILLDRYNSLGYLKGKSQEEQMEILKNKSDRELLVALHESTLGKPFSAIIEDEFKSINNPQAQSIYLTVSILHKLGSYTRAGLISRVHQINFEEFKEQFFKPLESIVFTTFNNRINDYVYTTRHPQIAEMVFETVLKDKQDKYDEYIRVLSNLNTDYNSDLNAFKAITNASNLLDLFDDPIKIRNLFELAEEKSPNDAKLFQQQAIFEMKRANGNLNLAEDFLKKAYKEAPNDPVIAHSFAEFSLKKAEKAKHKLEIFKHLDECKSICIKLIKKNDRTSHSYHTLLKSELFRLQYTVTNSDGPTIERLIKEIEKYISEAKQYYPDEPFLLETESQFNSLLNNIPEAQLALEKAYEINKSNPFICLRLANFHESQQRIEKAVEVCKETLKISPADRDVNFKLGLLLSKYESPSYQEILHSFRKSFVEGDTRYLAQLWFGRTCFILKSYQEAREVFVRIGSANVPPEVKYRPRGIIRLGGQDSIFTGKVFRKEVSFGLIRRSDFGDAIPFNRQTEEDKWDDIYNNSEVSFKIAFNYKGAMAINLSTLE